MWCWLQESGVGSGRRVFCICVGWWCAQQKGLSKSSFCKIRLSLGIRDSQIQEFVSRDSQVVEKCLADNQGIKMSESQGWDLYAVHI